MVRILRALFAVLVLLGMTGYRAASSAPVESAAVVVPVEGTVDEGMAHLVERAVAQANAEHASAVVLDINTPGGLVDAAFEIRDAMFAARVPTVAYVSQRAYSAGALIALSAQTIVMAPGSSIGAAEPIPNDPKHVSALRAEFASTASRNHRDATLAAAMVDKTVDAPEHKKAGAILTLTADEALGARVADAVAPSLAQALDDAKVAGPTRRVAYTFGESLARFATNPEVSGILLSLGVLGLLIEMQTLHGIAGALGATALGLFFGTHVYEGFSNGLVVALAIAGVLGILFELHVFPGHGVAGTVGVVALVAAIVLAFGFAFVFVAVQAISIAIVLSALALLLSSRVFPENAFFRRIAFAGVQGPDYVASSDHRALVGRTGFATSYLRPAGVANVDGRRVDVLTEGDFVPAGAPLRVSRVEGARVFVHPDSRTSGKGITFMGGLGAAVIVLAILLGIILFLYYFPLGLWIRTIAAGVPLSMMSLIRMRLIGIQPGVIVTNLVRARKAGLPLTIDQMQSHYLAGGNVENVTLAMIAAQRAQIPLEWQRASAIDLAGRNVLEALQQSVNPRVIETPIFQGVAQNGIQLNVKARITVRTNLDRYVGGAGEPTIVARVGEGVVSAVGAAQDHKEVLEYPDRISKAVLAKGLDAGTAYEIVSIDIADVDVGKNIGAELQTSQAEADRRIAQAKAAERQYSALAAEQEQKASTQAMRAKVVEAEAQIPQAIAEAFRDGHLGVMDYYRLNNIKADTDMRSAIGTGVAPGEAPASQQPKTAGT